MSVSMVSPQDVVRLSKWLFAYCAVLDLSSLDLTVFLPSSPYLSAFWPLSLCVLALISLVSNSCASLPCYSVFDALVCRGWSSLTDSR